MPFGPAAGTGGHSYDVIWPPLPGALEVSLPGAIHIPSLRPHPSPSSTYASNQSQRYPGYETINSCGHANGVRQAHPPPLSQRHYQVDPPVSPMMPRDPAANSLLEHLPQARRPLFDPLEAQNRLPSRRARLHMNTSLGRSSSARQIRRLEDVGRRVEGRSSKEVWNLPK